MARHQSMTKPKHSESALTSPLLPWRLNSSHIGVRGNWSFMPHKFENQSPRCGHNRRMAGDRVATWERCFYNAKATICYAKKEPPRLRRMLRALASFRRRVERLWFLSGRAERNSAPQSRNISFYFRPKVHNKPASFCLPALYLSKSSVNFP